MGSPKEDASARVKHDASQTVSQLALMQETNNASTDVDQKTEMLATPERQPSKVTIDSVLTEIDEESDPPTPLDSPQIPTVTFHTPSHDLLATLMEYLPKIVPNVLIKKRSGSGFPAWSIFSAFLVECIPVLATLVRDHPDPACRRTLIEMLFTLIKCPDEEQRQVHPRCSEMHLVWNVCRSLFKELALLQNV